jgi:hypothetical protein
MAGKPTEPPPPIRWNIYKFASVWLGGGVEARDESTVMEVTLRLKIPTLKVVHIQATHVAVHTTTTAILAALGFSWNARYVRESPTPRTASAGRRRVSLFTSMPPSRTRHIGSILSGLRCQDHRTCDREEMC